MPDGIYALADPSSRITTINFNNQFDLFGLKTCLTGRSFENFPMIDDAPAEKELPKQGSWLLNLVVGVLVTAALVAVAIVAAPAVAVIAAGAAVGAAVVTVAVAVADYGGEARSFGEFLGQLAMGVGLGALAGAMIYGLVVAAPIVAEAFGIQAAIWGGGASTFTVSTLPFMTKLGVFGLAGLQGLNMVNDCVTIGYGQNFLLDYVFGGNVSNYETAVMLMHLLSYGSMQVAANNAGLAKPKQSKLPSYADDQLDDIESETWNKGPAPRGKNIDSSGKLRNNLGDNFPVADRLKNGVLGSTKSYDIRCTTYQNASKWLSRMKSDIDKLHQFTAKTWNGVSVTPADYSSKQINVVIPNVPLTQAQQNALNSAEQYANSLGIMFKVYVTQ